MKVTPFAVGKSTFQLLTLINFSCPHLINSSSTTLRTYRAGSWRLGTIPTIGLSRCWIRIHLWWCLHCHCRWSWYSRWSRCRSWSQRRLLRLWHNRCQTSQWKDRSNPHWSAEGRRSSPCEGCLRSPFHTSRRCGPSCRREITGPHLVNT